MASTITAPKEAPQAPRTSSPSRLPVDVNKRTSGSTSEATAAQLASESPTATAEATSASMPEDTNPHSSQNIHDNLLDLKLLPSAPLLPELPRKFSTPPPSYNDLQPQSASESASESESVPAAPSYLPPPPPISIPGADTSQTPLAVVSESTVHPEVPPLKIPEESDSMFFSSQPQLPTLVETQASPTTLKKTRGRPRDGQSQPWSVPVPIKQNAISVPLRLHKSPIRGLSPSSGDQSRGRSVSAQPPLPGNPHNASISAEPTIRTHSTNSSEDGGSQSPVSGVTRSDRRRSWLPGLGGGGNRLRSKSHEPYAGTHSAAWVLASDSRADYNVEYLTNYEKVPELWDDNGTLYVYLSPPHSNHGASFKVHLPVIDQSRVLSSLVQSQVSSPASARSRARSFGGRDSLTAADANRIESPPMSPPLFSGTESRLHLPVTLGPDGRPDLERLIALRNLFALLTGQPLVATRSFPTIFAVLTQVAALLREFDFGFSTGSNNTFGDAVDISVGFYIDQTAFADVRFSREKTLEALVLSEQLRFWPLYNEAFCHAVGKYPALRDLKSPHLWDQISPNTLQRLERAHLDLLTRQHSVNTRLEQFDFPSLFAGVANSTSNSDYRHVRFKNWRTAFADMRSFVLKYYKTRFGSWPPKASSRRNPFSESGLNRLVLKTMYSDLCSVYDLLVNRKSITTRAGEDGTGPDAPSFSFPTQTPTADASIQALRQVLSEFDESSPPVLPPIPFDTPILPSVATINETFSGMSPKEQARFQKTIQPHELQLIVLKSHNTDAERPEESPFLAAFEAFELREAKRGKSETELTEMRIGHWLFLYVVLQSMPMLAIDAPGLRYTEGVEYFLCEPPQGRPPWVEDAGEVRKAWFQTGGGAGPLVELSADVLLYSVEATYHRSHCWLAAKKWNAETTRGSISSMSVAPNDLVVAQDTEGVAAAAAARVPSPMQPVTLPEIPMGFSLSISSSSPSLARPGTMNSAADPRSTATESATSSPRIAPTSYDKAPENNISPASSSPALAAQRHSQYSPQIQPIQQLPQRRDNYLQLQDRARLRHASIGWALEPVDLAHESHAHPPKKQLSTRRIASAGNLRAMVEASGNANYRQGSLGTLAVPGTSERNGQDTFNSGSTFDSILNNMDSGPDLKKSKKRNSFLPFM